MLIFLVGLEKMVFLKRKLSEPLINLIRLINLILKRGKE
jgi:hypothetical protein